MRVEVLVRHEREAAAVGEAERCELLGREHCRKNDEVRVVAQFEEKGLRKTSDSRRARDAKLADEELGHMNYELKIRRRARLNDLYNALGEQ